MNTIDTELLAFLKQQLEWHQEQDRILAEIESKLFELREIAEYRKNNDIAFLEMQYVQSRVEDLKMEIELLEQKLDTRQVN